MTNSKEKNLTAAPGEELVEVMLFKDGNKYRDDVFVAVNGVGCQIRRGETVHIKRKYAQVLQQSMAADTHTEFLKEDFARDFESRSKSLGM